MIIASDTSEQQALQNERDESIYPGYALPLVAKVSINNRQIKKQEVKPVVSRRYPATVRPVVVHLGGESCDYCSIFDRRQEPACDGTVPTRPRISKESTVSEGMQPMIQRHGAKDGRVRPNASMLPQQATAQDIGICCSIDIRLEIRHVDEIMDNPVIQQNHLPTWIMALPTPDAVLNDVRRIVQSLCPIYPDHTLDGP